VVGFHLACRVLQVAFFHERNIVGLLFGEILCAQDIFEFFTQTIAQGSPLNHIVPIEVHDEALELCILCDEVSVALT
jgi:hypothetical protein